VALGEGAILVVSGDKLRADEQETLGGFATQLSLARHGRRLAVEAAGAVALGKANELRTALLAAVSHDLRTPLASIRAAATALLSADVELGPDSSRELLQTIDEEAERLNKLVGSPLDMSRLQTGAFAVRPEPVGVEELVAAAAIGLPDSRTRLDIDVLETLPRVDVDPALTERALANLMGNALAFSPAGSVVRVEGGVVGDQVHVRVVDAGKGIAPRDHARVFQPFQRLGDRPNGAGVGLGLAVAKGSSRPSVVTSPSKRRPVGARRWS
jgi:two-component system sensor histidine kinase KdpD